MKMQKVLETIESIVNNVHAGYKDQKEFVEYVIINYDRDPSQIFQICNLRYRIPEDASKAYLNGKAIFNLAHLRLRWVAGLIVTKKGLDYLLAHYDVQRYRDIPEYCDIPKEVTDLIFCVNERSRP